MITGVLGAKISENGGIRGRIDDFIFFETRNYIYYGKFCKEDNKMHSKMQTCAFGYLTLPILALLAGCSDNSTQADNLQSTPTENPAEQYKSVLCSSPVDLGKSDEYNTISYGEISLDVVIRDFQSNHPDFENFSEEAVEHMDDITHYVTETGAAMSAFGYGDDWVAASSYHNTCGNTKTLESGVGVEIGTDGLPMKTNSYLPSYLQQLSKGSVLEYGECQDHIVAQTGNRGLLRGYSNADKGIFHRYVCEHGAAWKNPVIATTGMVKPYLTFKNKALDGSIDMYDGVVISKANERCDNANFDQWFTDVPSVNKRVNAVLELTEDSTGYYVLDHGYNNGGFFPLDSIDPVTGKWVKYRDCNIVFQPNGECDQYGPQSLSIFCPPYNYQYAATQMDAFGENTAMLCKEWLNQGGPRSLNPAGDGVSAAVAAVKKYGNVGLRNLRNFHFTMTSYSLLKYEAASPQVMEFASSGDMWVFVDGVLVADMGGDHMVVPSFVNLKTLAENNHGCHKGEPLAGETNCKGASDKGGWADGSVHHLHIFYANRQTNGSEIFFRFLPAVQSPSRYGLFKMNSIAIATDSKGDAWNLLHMSTPFSDSSYANVTNDMRPSMLVLRKNTKGKTQVLGLLPMLLEKVGEEDLDGQLYKFSGRLKDINGNDVEGGLVSGDRIAFNVPWSEKLADSGNQGKYSDDEWEQLMAWAKKMPYHLTSPSGRIVSAFDDWDGVVEIGESCSDAR